MLPLEALFFNSVSVLLAIGPQRVRLAGASRGFCVGNTSCTVGWSCDPWSVLDPRLRNRQGLGAVRVSASLLFVVTVVRGHTGDLLG